MFQTITPFFPQVQHNAAYTEVWLLCNFFFIHQGALSSAVQKETAGNLGATSNDSARTIDLIYKHEISRRAAGQWSRMSILPQKFCFKNFSS